MNKKSSLYIAGHTGLVGQALTRYYLAKGYFSLITQTHKQLDLTQSRLVDTLFKKTNPEYVIIAAARVGGIKPNMTYPYEFLHENLAITTNIINAAITGQVKKLLYISCGCAYPTNAPTPIKEESLLTGIPESTNEGFALAKIAGIKLSQTANRQFKKNFISCIPANTYGVGDHFEDERSHVIPALIKRFHQAKISDAPSVTLWGSGKARREFIYVDDLARGLAFLMDTYNNEEVINIGSGEDVEMGELAQLIKKTVGYEGKISYDTTKPDGMMRRVLDSTKMSELGFKPTIRLQEGLVKTYRYFLETHK